MPESSSKRSFKDPKLSFVGFLIVTCVVGVILVSVAQLLYVNSDEYLLDLTRPDFNDIKEEDLLQVDQNTTFDTTGPIDEQVVKSEIQSIEDQQKSLNQQDDFQDTTIEDYRKMLLE